MLAFVRVADVQRFSGTEVLRRERKRKRQGENDAGKSRSEKSHLSGEVQLLQFLVTVADADESTDLGALFAVTRLDDLSLLSLPSCSEQINARRRRKESDERENFLALCKTFRQVKLVDSPPLSPTSSRCRTIFGLPSHEE